MNCKPGDLAVIVKSVTGASVGKIVRVVELLPLARLAFPDGILEMPAWTVEEKIESWRSGDSLVLVPDAWLRPIRDQDGEDETLTWAGKPSDIKTPEAA